MIWLALFLVAPVLWCGIRLTMPSVVFDFDFDQAHATFFSLWLQYSKIAWSVFWVGVIGGFLDQHFIERGYFVMNEAPAILLASAIYAILFNVWTLTTYERYLQSRYPRAGGYGVSTYTAGKYSLTLALAVSTLGTFVLGLVLALSGSR